MSKKISGTVLNVQTTCSRCRREGIRAIASDEALDVQKTANKRAARQDEIQAFLAGIPADELPEFLSLVRGPDGKMSLTMHDYLCKADVKEGEEGKKRSCASRVAALLAGADELDERKPRAPKAKPEGAAADGAEKPKRSRRAKAGEAAAAPTAPVPTT